MAQFARPDSDIATGSWSATPLWSKIDEGDPGDDTTITSDNNTSPDNADFTLSDVSDPGVDTNHIIRVEWNKDSSGGHSINAVAELWQGTPGTGTLIATLSVTGIGATPQTDTYTLTSTEAGNITDYTGLTLRLSRQGDTGGSPSGRRSLVVDFAELEVPDAATQVDANLTGPAGTLSSNTSVLLSTDASLTGPVGTLSSSADVLLQATSSLTGPVGTLSSLLDALLSINSSLTGPSPTVSANVSAAEDRTVNAALTGPSPVVSATVDNIVSATSSLTGPSSSLSSNLKVIVGLSSNLSGPLNTANSQVKVLCQVDSAMIGPSGSMSGEIGEVQTVKPIVYRIRGRNWRYSISVN